MKNTTKNMVALAAVAGLLSGAYVNQVNAETIETGTNSTEKGKEACGGKHGCGGEKGEKKEGCGGKHGCGGEKGEKKEGCSGKNGCGGEKKEEKKH